MQRLAHVCKVGVYSRGDLLAVVPAQLVVSALGANERKPRGVQCRYVPSVAENGIGSRRSRHCSGTKEQKLGRATCESPWTVGAANGSKPIVPPTINSVSLI